MTKSKLSEKEQKKEIPGIKKAETSKSTNNSHVFENRQETKPATKVEESKRQS